MAVESVCGKLLNGQDNTCVVLTRRYYQQAVVINRSDIDPASIAYLRTDFSSPSPVCAYGVSFELKPGKTGFLFAGLEAGSAYFGTFDKTRNDQGYPQYAHNANLIVAGANIEAKCILSGLDKGSYVVAYQFADGTVEIYGIGSGLTTGDYSGDIQTNGGVVSVVLSSLEVAPENDLPMVYVSAVPGQESEDFDALFANSGS